MSKVPSQGHGHEFIKYLCRFLHMLINCSTMETALGERSAEATAAHKGVNPSHEAMNVLPSDLSQGQVVEHHLSGTAVDAAPVTSELPAVASQSLAGDAHKMADDGGLLDHLNSLGHDVVGTDSGVGSLTLMDASANPLQSTTNHLIGVRTDLQDHMHVAKAVTDVEGVLAFCSALVPGSARSTPTPKIDFAKLSDARGLHLQGVLGERGAVVQCFVVLFLDLCIYVCFENCLFVPDS